MEVNGRKHRQRIRLLNFKENRICVPDRAKKITLSLNRRRRESETVVMGLFIGKKAAVGASRRTDKNNTITITARRRLVKYYYYSTLSFSGTVIVGTRSGDVDRY